MKPKRMGRPKIKPEYRKRVAKTMRVSKDQLDRLQGFTKKMRISDSNFMRHAIFYTIEQIERGDIDPDEFYESAMKRQTPLETLLFQVTPDNLHGEVNTGDPVGVEVW